MAFDGYRTLGRLGLFVSLVGLEVWLGTSMSGTATIRGFLDTKSYGVSSPHKALVRKLDVVLGQTVTEGEIIAELDATAIEDEIVVDTAERKRILAGRLGKGTSGSGNSAEGDDDSNEALRVIDVKLEQLASKREALRLRSPAAGVIESIDARIGDSVGPDSPVATVVAHDTRRVVACIPEARLDDVAVGTSADITPVVGGASAHGVVESVTPAVAQLPERCQSPFAKLKGLGRVAVVRLDAPSAMLPGQSELVAFGALTAPPAPEPIAAAEAEPVLIAVPSEISDASAFEASGLVWVSRLDRYVVVSDDTGSQGASHHAPWLFTMSRHGHLDPEPLLVEDLSELDDVESIALGDHDTLWLMSSQSVSEKGRRSTAREQLIRLVPTARGYRADAKVTFAKLLDEAPEAVRAALSVPDTRALDIEGLAARDGALYVGLKSPQDAHGNAIIWKIAAPERLLAGDLTGAGLAIWGTVPLTARMDDHEIPAGIADLVFVSDDWLLAGATAPKAMGKGQSGELYSIARKGTALAATRVRTFPHLRPEGVALSPQPNHATIVFDRGKDPAMWLDIELPPPPGSVVAEILTLHRREYKYIIDEGTADRVRRYMDGICSLDPYAATGGGRYVCDTLYLDTLQLDLYRATIENEPDRYKLRIRAYPEAPTAPVFLEVKRRVDEVIIKTRGKVVPAHWQQVVETGTLDGVALDQHHAVENFLSHQRTLVRGPVVPAVLVRYEREPYTSRIDHYARVTFDRKLCYQPQRRLALVPEHDQWTYVDDPVSMRGAPAQSMVVLELKFATPVPGWMRRMVQALELTRLAFCKYGRAVDSVLHRPRGREPRFGFRA